MNRDPAHDAFGHRIARALKRNKTSNASRHKREVRRKRK